MRSRRPTNAAWCTATSSPANIKITSDDKVKVLDFGLAKALASDDASATAGLSHSPTLSMMATQAGVILGTAAYMSPEQAKGSPADQRSDIFAFGTVLYEMLSGRQPFKGETAPEILASVLVRDPDLSGLPANLNPRLLELLQRCLEKHPKKRWQAIGDVRAEIERIAVAPHSSITAVTGAQKPLWRRALTVSAAAVAGALVAAAAVWSLIPAPAVSVSRFSVALAEGQRFSNTGRQMVAVSPDGTKLAYTANGQLYLRTLSDLDAKPITSVQNLQTALNPTFSPDGESLVFWASVDRTLKHIAVTGGAAVTLCEAEPPYGISWSGDTIFFAENGQNSQGTPGGIFRVAASGGKPARVVSLKGTETAYGPQLLPGGEWLLFTLATGTGTSFWDKATIVAQSLKTGERRTLIEGGSDARYAPTGHLVYALGTVLFAVPFDLNKMAVTGGPTPIVPVVQRAGMVTGAAHFSFSDTGTLGYVSNAGAVNAGRLVYRARDGRELRRLTEQSEDFPRYPRLAPDGHRLAATLGPQQAGDIWIFDFKEGRQPLKVTFEEGHDTMPIWTKDGSRIIYGSVRSSGSALWSVASDGSERIGKEIPLGAMVGNTTIRALDITPDGLLLFSINQAKTRRDLMLVSLDDAKATPRAWLNAEYDEDDARVSPDGRFVAYAADPAGQPEIWVRPYPGPGAPVRISQAGGHEPVWSRDGKGAVLPVGLKTDVRQDPRDHS